VATYKRMPPLLLYLTLFAATLLAAAAGRVPVLSKAVDPDPIARLDDCIQRRFLGARAFGMSRVLPNRYHGIVQFQPENAVEQQVVADLTREGYQVALFLAGRHVLDTTPSNALILRLFGLQGPALISNITTATALPGREALLTEGRKAMQSLAGLRVALIMSLGRT
jgi:hypothetical protein